MYVLFYNTHAHGDTGPPRENTRDEETKRDMMHRNFVYTCIFGETPLRSTVLSFLH